MFPLVEVFRDNMTLLLPSVLGAGCWVLGAGCWVLGVGCWVSGVGCRVSGVGCDMSRSDKERDREKAEKSGKPALRIFYGPRRQRLGRCRNAPEKCSTAADGRLDPEPAHIIEICDADYRSFSLPCDALEGGAGERDGEREGERKEGETLREPSRPYGMGAVSLPASGCSSGPARLCIQ